MNAHDLIERTRARLARASIANLQIYNNLRMRYGRPVLHSAVDAALYASFEHEYLISKEYHDDS